MKRHQKSCGKIVDEKDSNAYQHPSKTFRARWDCNEWGSRAAAVKITDELHSGRSVRRGPAYWDGPLRRGAPSATLYPCP